MFSSHILCKVDDLHSAIELWRKAGFEVQLGNKAEKAINALIWFERGPFIELIDAQGAKPPGWFLGFFKHILKSPWVGRFDRWVDNKPGWCELALETTGDLKPVLGRLRSSEMKIFGPVPNRRQPPNSPVIQTQTAFPHCLELPILMGAYKPDPRPAHVQHPNGAIEIDRIEITIPEETAQDWQALLDTTDTWLKIRVGTDYAVNRVTIRGLNRTLDPRSINGAVVEPATPA
ncbi:MAG: VOC family protein [Pseudomonadota bacterium]